MDKIAEFWNRVERSLFAQLDWCVEVLTPKHRHLALVLELVRIEEHIRPDWIRRRGRKRSDRKALARAFVAKSLLNLSTTKALIERLLCDTTLRQLCGWDTGRAIPSESTFCRCFAEFAETRFADSVHEALVETHLADDLIWHISRDSTAIPARERVHPKADKPKPKRGRPRKTDPPPAPKRMFKQLVQSATEAIAELPKNCDVGIKPDASGRRHPWVGYKLHVDVADGCLPISAITTSASLHDSQAAIPLAKMTAGRVTSLYDLMDSAYDAFTIREASELLGHVPIIDSKRVAGQAKTPMEPDRAYRYRNRTTVERFNSQLKDNHGGRNIRVRGQPKVHAHLMFGIIVVFAEALLGLL